MNRENLLNEFVEQGYELEKLKPYKDFLIECSQKNYGNLATHRHHILPRCMEGSNSEYNLIPLSIEDHYRAHRKLANCFDSGTSGYSKNLAGANLIIKHHVKFLKLKHGADYKQFFEGFWKVERDELKTLMVGRNHHTFGRIKTEKERKEISERQQGEKNPFFGKTHTLEARRAISFGGKKRSGENNSFFGTKKNLSIETKEKLSKKSKESHELYNGEISRIKKIHDTRSGIIYNCKSDAVKDLNLSKSQFKWLLFDGILVEIEQLKSEVKITRKHRGNYAFGMTCPKSTPIMNLITREVYSSISELSKFLGVSAKIIDRYVKEEKYKRISKEEYFEAKIKYVSI